MLTSDKTYPLRARFAAWLVPLALLAFAPAAFAQFATRSISVGDFPTEVAINEATNTIFVANFYGGTVTVIDGDDLSTQTVDARAGAVAVAVNETTNTIFVANRANASVTVIDGDDLSTQTVDVPDFPVAVAINEATNTIFVASGYDDIVTVIDGDDLSTRAVQVGDSPTAIAVNEATNTIFVADGSGNTVTVIDGNDLSTQTVTVGYSPLAVAVNEATNTIFVANRASGTVTVIDGDDLSTQTVGAGIGPWDVAVNETTGAAFVVSGDGNTGRVINGDDLSNQAVEVGYTPVAIAINEATNTVFVANRSGNTVTVIDGDDLSAQTIPVGAYPIDIAVNETTGTAFVTNGDDDTVTVIAEGLNQAPIADAGTNQTVIAGQTVTLDGSGSSDLEDDDLTFAWTIAGPGSPALSDAATADPAFCAAQPGAYTATLAVSDGVGDPVRDEAIITALSSDAALAALDADVRALGADATLNDGQVRALTRKLDQARRLLARGKTAEALAVLGDFRQQALDVEAEGVLSADEAAGLVASVDAITGVLAAPCSNAASAARVATAAALVAAKAGALTVGPNPTSGAAVVRFELAEAGPVRLAVYDAVGRSVAVLADGYTEAGTHAAVLDASTLPAGVYVVHIVAGSGGTATRQLTVVR